jgi:DNA-binding NarL/FixJ family response regulator
VLLGRGLSNRQIAAELVLTEGTANSYVKRVLRRLSLHSRSQVAAWAVEHGLSTVRIEP